MALGESHIAVTLPYSSFGVITDYNLLISEGEPLGVGSLTTTKCWHEVNLALAEPYWTCAVILIIFCLSLGLPRSKR